MLDGTLRGQLMARRRLVEAGEYAVPALLQTLIETKNPEMELRVTEVLEEIKRQAVLPLCAALPEVSPTVQAKICRILSSIGWPTAIPFLLETAADRAPPRGPRRRPDRLPSPRRHLDRRLRRLRPSPRSSSRRSSRSSPTPPTRRTWSGATASTAPRPDSGADEHLPSGDGDAVHPHGGVDADATNRMAARDLRGRRSSPGEPARRRRVGSLRARTRPIRPSSSPPPRAARSPATSSPWRSTPTTPPSCVTRSPALGNTVGRGDMFASGGRAPLRECLRFPDRRVQYDAALVLGRAPAFDGFPGDTQVVPLLASAVRAGNTSSAVVVADAEEDRNRFASLLQSNGFQVVASGADFYDLENEINRRGAIDLVLVQSAGADAVDTVGRIRAFERTGATPVMLVASAVDGVSLGREFATDRATVVWNGGGSDDQFDAALTRLMDVAAGGRMSDMDSIGYTQDALQTLATIARSGQHRLQDRRRRVVASRGDGNDHRWHAAPRGRGGLADRHRELPAGPARRCPLRRPRLPSRSPFSTSPPPTPARSGPACFPARSTPCVASSRRTPVRMVTDRWPMRPGGSTAP